MASISNRPNGHKWIQFLGIDDRRHTIRLGKVSKKAADTFRRHVDELLDCQISGEQPRESTKDWLNELPGRYREKLVRFDLCGDIDGHGLNELLPFIEQYLADRRDLKPNSLCEFHNARSNLIEFFGPYRKLHAITVHDAEQFDRFLRRIKGYFKAAVKMRRLSVS